MRRILNQAANTSAKSGSLPRPADELHHWAGTVAIDGTFLPAGRLLYTQLGRKISVVEKDGTEPHTLASGPPEAFALFAPCVLPDGTQVAFTGVEGEHTPKNEIFEMAAAGGIFVHCSEGEKAAFPKTCVAPSGRLTDAI